MRLFKWVIITTLKAKSILWLESRWGVRLPRTEEQGGEDRVSREPPGAPPPRHMWVLGPHPT